MLKNILCVHISAFWKSNIFKKMESAGHHHFEQYVLVGPKQSSIPIVLNENGKQDGGNSVNLE